MCVGLGAVFFSVLTLRVHVPIAKPSDIMCIRALDNAGDIVQVELIEAERRFFCVYKWVHGVKFQVVCLPNGMIGNLAGNLLFEFDIVGNVSHAV